MRLITAVELMRAHQTCPQCNSGMIGNGEGTLVVTEDVFKRTCKCGWSIEVNPKAEGHQSTESAQAPAGGRIGGSYE
ncbi:DUF3797 domain-containing protein [Paenibacillus sp. FSL R10-2771]|uniref:DUF3797 domain-containing protein n=1 Tax=Paenibacillus sp. FSL R10-2771 TaxID=2954693 RepID=UPI0030F5C4F2